MKLSGARILLECLKREGVDLIFGLPGGAVLPIYDVLYDFRGHSPHPRAAGGRGGPRGGGLLAHDGQGRRLPRHLRARRDEPGHRAPGRADGLDPDRRLHRAGADAPDRQRRVPGSRQRRHHALGDQAQLPGQGRQGPGAHHQGGVPHRLHRPSRARARGPAEGHPRQGVALRVSVGSAPALLQPDVRGASRADQEGRAVARAGQAAGALRGRRRHLVGRLARARRAGGADPGPGDADPHGARRLPDGASPVPRHAGHARDVLRQHGGAPLGLPRRDRRALRRPRHRARWTRSRRTPRSSTSTSIPRRSRRTSRSHIPIVGDCKRVLRKLVRGRARRAEGGRARRRARGAQAVGRADRGVEAGLPASLRLGRRRHQAPVRHPGDLEPHARGGADGHRGGPAPDVGGPVLPVQAPAVVVHLGRPRHHGLRAADRHGRAGRQSRASS